MLHRSNPWTAAVMAIGVLAPMVAWSAPAKRSSASMDELYREGQRRFHRRNYVDALTSFEKYLTQSKTQSYRRERLLWVIDQIGRIHLRERRDPDAAIRFFTPLTKDRRLNEAEADLVDGWLRAARDWKSHAALPDTAKTGDELFERGRTYYRKGVEQTQAPGDDSGNAYMHVAASYLLPFIINYDRDPRVGEALLMMGDVRRRSWTDPAYWSDNHYLREAIRRFPHTPLARKAYDVLERDVRFGYTGSSGDNTPPSLQRMLRHFKALSEKK